MALLESQLHAKKHRKEMRRRVIRPQRRNQMIERDNIRKKLMATIRLKRGIRTLAIDSDSLG